MRTAGDIDFPSALPSPETPKELPIVDERQTQNGASRSGEVVDAPARPSESRCSSAAQLRVQLVELLPALHEMKEKEDMSSHMKMSLQAACPMIQQLIFCLDTDLPFLVGEFSQNEQQAEHPNRVSYYDTVSPPASPRKSENTWASDGVRSSISGLEVDVTVGAVHNLLNVTPDIGSLRPSFQVAEDEEDMDHFDSMITETLEDEMQGATSLNQCYIHPERPFKLLWDFCSLMLILSLMITIPLELAFYWKDEAPSFFNVISRLVDTFYFSDIVLSFFTAHHEGNGISGRLVTDFKGIAKHYARGWLIIDILATFPYTDVVKLTVRDDDGDEGSSAADATGMLRVVRIAKVARVMKVLRVLKLGGLMQIVEEKLVAVQSMTVAFQLTKMTIVMLLLCHIVACMWYAVAALNESGERTWLFENSLMNAGGEAQYLAAFYFAITTGTTVGYGDISPQNTVERCCTSLLLILSVGYITQFLSKVSVMISSLRRNENMVAESKREALLFMTQRSVPKDLQFKVLRFIEHTAETHSITAMDTNLMANLSKSLQSELALSVTGHVIKKFPLFAELGDDFLSSICRVGHTQRAGTGEIIVYEEQPAREMYWIVAGEVAVIRKGRTLTTLFSRDWFGELVLFFNGVVRSATVRCESHCEFFVLHHDEFQETMRQFRHVKRYFEKLVRELLDGDMKGLDMSRVCPLVDEVPVVNDDGEWPARQISCDK